MGNTEIWSASIRAAGIELAPYDFPGSAFYPNGLCRWEDVREIDAQAAPPELRTAHEVLFVSAAQKDALVHAAQVRGIANIRRVDVWGLLEPFLDASFDDAHIERTYAALARCGIERTTCATLRKELAPVMTAYNFDSMLWDWCHLGLCDTLCALRGELVDPRYRLPDTEFAAFYRRAMALALRATLLPA